MSDFVKLRNILRLVLIVVFLLTSLLTIQSRVTAQSSSTPFWVVRSIDMSEYGVNNPKGLAFSAQANTFIIVDESANAALVTMGEDPAGVRNIPEVQNEPLNLAFNNQLASLFIFNRANSELLQVKADNQGAPDPSALPTRFPAKAFGVKDAQGITFDPGTGRLFILDAGKSQIVSIAPHPTLGFDENEAVRANKVQHIQLKNLGVGLLRGLAYNPGNGHLYLAEPDAKVLYEITEEGDLVSTFDLAAAGINDPHAMTFAPSGDNTDDPGISNLFILDSNPGFAAESGSTDGQVVELSMVTPAALPAGTTLIPTSLVRTIDTSKAVWNPSAPDPSGVDYWPLTGRLLISDSEVDEMSNYFTGKNVFDSTLSGALAGTCSTTNLSRNGFSNEPTGVGINPGNNRIYFTDDNANRLFEVSLGSDGKYCTGDDVVTTINIGSLYNIQDAEDVAYGTNTVFVAGGDDAEVYRIPLGGNGVLGGGDDGPVTHFDTASLGFRVLEGLGYSQTSGALLLLSPYSGDAYIGEVSTAGVLLRAYDVSYLTIKHREDVAFAPNSQDPTNYAFYIADRGVDNNTNSQENDGKIWQVSVSGSSTPAPSPTPPTATVTPGPTPTNPPQGTDLIFADNFESGNLAAWSSSAVDAGDLGVSAGAALIGGQGLQAVIDDVNAIFVTSDHPNAESRYRARFYFDPNSLAMTSGDAHMILRGYSGTSTVVMRIEFGFASGAYRIRAALMNDGTTWTQTNWFAISDAAHAIEVDWRAATALGANNGGLTLWIDGAQKQDLAGIDNDTRRMDRVRLGATTGLDAGTRGTYFFDAFESRRQSYIGP